MASSEASKKGWNARIPKGYMTISDAARLCGRHTSVARTHAMKLEIVKQQGKGSPALIKEEDVELLREALKEVPTGTPRVKPEPEPKAKIEAPKWTEPTLVPTPLSPERDFEQSIRKVIHLMEKLKIDSITIQDGKAEILRTVTVTKKEQIKG